MRAPTTTIDPPAEQTGAPEPADTSWWRARPGAALALRIAIFLAPILVSILVSWGIASRWPRPPGLAPSIGWWVVLIAAGSLAMLGVDRAARRLLPLSTLLRMSLVFPDEKPSRFGVALRNGTTRQLERRLADVQENGLVGNERQAAEQLLGLVAALRLHDRFTRGHGERVRAYSALIGEELGLDEIELSKLQWAGLIHDVGKLAVPDEVLNKPGKLTDEEFELIKTHPAEGMKLVGPLAPWLGEWVLAVGEHHERWDGTGYPNRLAGTEISRAGRIVAVADVFDVITAARSYKAPQAPHAAREELARHAGSQFDPEMVRAFLNVSIGRIRTVMWPLSWLANVPYLGSTVTAPATSWLAPALVAVGGAVTGGSLADEPVPPAPPVTVEVGDGSSRGRVDGADDGGDLLPVRGAAGNPALVSGTTTTSTVPSATTTLTTTTLAGSTGSTTIPIRTPITGHVVVVGPPPGIPQSTPTTATTTTLPITSGTLPLPTTPPTTVPPPTIPPTTVPTIPTPTLPLPTLPTLPTTLPPVPTTLPPVPTTLPPLTPCELLEQGATALPGADLSGCNLAGLDLNGVDLTGANLGLADLRGTTLSNFDLTGAALAGALLDGATFTNGVLSGIAATDVDWSNTLLNGVDLAGAQLIDADFDDVQLSSVSFKTADLTGAGFAGATFDDVDFSDARLVDANLSELSLVGARFSRANATDADFSRSNLRGARLDGAVLRRADLGDANLTNAVVTDAVLRSADLSGTNFTGAVGRPATTLFAIFDLTICPNGLPSIITCWP